MCTFVIICSSERKIYWTVHNCVSPTAPFFELLFRINNQIHLSNDGEILALLYWSEPLIKVCI